MMSWVTDVLVLCSLEECLGENGFVPASQEPPVPIANLNQWLLSRGLGKLVCLDQYALGGGKAFQAVVFGSAFNHLPVAEFVAALQSQSWAAPESVQLLTKDEEAPLFVLHSPAVASGA
nr:putative integron gene cassette protein [uncultured bacterium]CAS02638.1 putative integron gene cassette protein [uncultured bacterium]